MIDKFALAFPLPARESAADPELELSPKALAAWLETLPYAMPDRCAAMLLRTVHRVNRLRLNENEREVFAAALEAPAHTLLETLHAKLHHVAVPPLAKEIDSAQRVIRLHEELALSFRYLIVPSGVRAASGRAATAKRAAVIHRTLHHLCEALKVHYLLKIAPPRDLWIRTYGLYGLARDEGLLAHVPPPLPGRPAVSLDDTFKTTILMSMAGPNALRGNDLEALCKVLPELVGHVEFIPASATTAAIPAFVVGLVSNEPPTASDSPRCGDCLHGGDCLAVNVEPLLLEVKKRIREQRRHSPKPAGTLVPELHMLRRLRSQLGNARKRRSKRLDWTGEARIIAGFRHIHSFAAKRVRPVGREAGRERPPLIDHNVVMNLELVTIETPAYFDAPGYTPAPLREKLNLDPLACEILNVSAGGYCLAMNKARGLRLNTGELVLIQESGQARWLPAEISWVANSSEKLNLGVKLLSPHFSVGKTVCRNGEHTRTAECLLFSDGSDTPPSSIVMAPTCAAKGTRLSLESSRSNGEIILSRELTHTQGYVRFALEFVESTEFDEDTILLEAMESGEQLGDDSSSEEAEQKPWRRFL